MYVMGLDACWMVYHVGRLIATVPLVLLVPCSSTTQKPASTPNLVTVIAWVCTFALAQAALCFPSTNCSKHIKSKYAVVHRCQKMKGDVGFVWHYQHWQQHHFSSSMSSSEHKDHAPPAGSSISSNPPVLTIGAETATMGTVCTHRVIHENFTLPIRHRCLNL